MRANGSPCTTYKVYRYCAGNRGSTWHPVRGIPRSAWGTYQFISFDWTGCHSAEFGFSVGANSYFADDPHAAASRAGDKTGVILGVCVGRLAIHCRICRLAVAAAVFLIRVTGMNRAV